ncbi:hypothetical protein R6Q57_002188 [Mikania cordata]
MEQNPPIVVKKVWSLMRAIFFMLKKGISKAKLFTDLNMLMKRGQLAGKSLHNLLFRHHRNWAAATFFRHSHHLPSPTPPSGEYEFSCSNTPPYLLSLFKKNQNKQHIRDINEINKHTRYNPDTDKVWDGCDGGKPGSGSNMLINARVMKALENMLTSAVASPGFVNSPVVKQLRITDSPFPLSDRDEDCKVDEAADKFIMSFYNDLRRQIKAK